VRQIQHYHFTAVVNFSVTGNKTRGCYVISKYYSLKGSFVTKGHLELGSQTCGLEQAIVIILYNIF
jgi:hypothetical protein